MEYQLQLNTLRSAIDLFEAYLTHTTVVLADIQITICACFFITATLIETVVLDEEALVIVSDKCFTKDRLAETIRTVLTTVGFRWRVQLPDIICHKRKVDSSDNETPSPKAQHVDSINSIDRVRELIPASVSPSSEKNECTNPVTLSIPTETTEGSN